MASPWPYTFYPSFTEGLRLFNTEQVLGAYVLPTMPFNTSEEYASFEGTVSLSPATVMLMLEEIVEGLRGQRFHMQVLTVGHGGSLWLGAFVKHVNRRLEDIVLVDAHRGAN